MRDFARDVSGGPTRGPIEGRPIWIFSIIYTPEESLGRPPPAGTPADLTYDLTYVEWLQFLIKRLWLIKKCVHGSYAADVDHFARKQIGPLVELGLELGRPIRPGALLRRE